MSEDDTFYWALYFFERIDVAPIEVMPVPESNTIYVSVLFKKHDASNVVTETGI